MSQTPTEANPEEPQDYLSAWARLGIAMKRGRSFSGREPNCCFLNTRGSRFADVSVVTGLDHLDDSRGVALADWDDDGDLDLWFTNRTGPSVRFLRNDAIEARNSSFLGVRLVGDPARGTNRDAIGARIELELISADGKTRHRQLRSVHGGDGFLSQSSKWVHFGLGESKRIDSLTVRWPGARTDVEKFTGLVANHRYRLVQGSGKAVAMERRSISLKASVPAAAKLSESAHIRLLNTPTVPDLRYEGLDGKTTTLSSLPKRPLLLSLWATWCAPCLAELKALAGEKEKLNGHKLTVLALNVDGLDGGKSAAGVKKAQPARIQNVLENLGYPFRAGIGTVETVERLNAVLHEIIYSQKPLPLPVSFLLDETRRLRAVYKGALNLQDLLADLETLASPPETIQDRFVPFPGRYSTGLFIKDPVTVARIWLEGDYPDDARVYLERHLQSAPQASGPPATEADRKRYTELASVHHLLGNLREEDSLPERAVEHYRAAMRFFPSFPRPANDLAWLRATHPDPAYRDGAEAVRLASQVCQSTRFEVPEPMDTLAAAYAESGQFEQAVEVAERAVAVADTQGRAGLVNEIRQRLGLYRQGQAYRSP